MNGSASVCVVIEAVKVVAAAVFAHAARDTECAARGRPRGVALLAAPDEPPKVRVRSDALRSGTTRKVMNGLPHARLWFSWILQPDKSASRGGVSTLSPSAATTASVPPCGRFTVRPARRFRHVLGPTIANRAGR